MVDWSCMLSLLFVYYSLYFMPIFFSGVEPFILGKYKVSVITFALVPPHYWYVVMSCLLQQKMSEKCFNKCVHYPNNELDPKEQVAVPIDFFKLLQYYVNHYYRSAYPLVLTDLWKRGTLYLRHTLKECKKGQNSSEYSFILLYQ